MPTTAPPDVPPNTPQPVADYLRRFGTWAYQQIDSKVPQNAGVPSILLLPSDQKTPTTVFKLTVDSSGDLHVTKVPLGGGQP
jgi:hypothetical protein